MLIILELNGPSDPEMDVRTYRSYSNVGFGEAFRHSHLGWPVHHHVICVPRRRRAQVPISDWDVGSTPQTVIVIQFHVEIEDGPMCTQAIHPGSLHKVHTSNRHCGCPQKIGLRNGNEFD